MEKREEKTQKPKVSVVVPILNEEKQLPVLLRSLQACYSLDIEVIIVDGKSEDNTRGVAEKFNTEATDGFDIKWVVSDKRNVSYQRNLGAKNAKNEVIVFLDADVAIVSDQTFYELITKFSAGGYASASVRFAPIEDDRRARIYYNLLFFFHKIMEHIDPYAVGSCILTTKRVVKLCGGFDPTIRINEDANFVKRTTQCGKFKIFNIPVQVSSRRFEKHGYLRMGLKYIRIFFVRTFKGEIRDTKIKYEFGEYG